jgi:hypothetical protein
MFSNVRQVILLFLKLLVRVTISLPSLTQARTPSVVLRRAAGHFGL